MNTQKILINLFLQKKITYNSKMYMQEVHYYTDDVLVHETDCLDNYVEFTICHCRLLESFDLEIHSRHANKNSPPLRHLIASATD